MISWKRCRLATKMVEGLEGYSYSSDRLRILGLTIIYLGDQVLESGSD